MFVCVCSFIFLVYSIFFVLFQKIRVMQKISDWIMWVIWTIHCTLFSPWLELVAIFYHCGEAWSMKWTFQLCFDVNMEEKGWWNYLFFILCIIFEGLTWEGFSNKYHFLCDFKWLDFKSCDSLHIILYSVLTHVMNERISLASVLFGGSMHVILISLYLD